MFLFFTQIYQIKFKLADFLSTVYMLFITPKIKIVTVYIITNPLALK